MKSRLLCVLTVAGMTLAASGSLGAGYYNMPTNLRQCLGYGYGPGYHAPMLLGPMMKSGIEAQRLRRTPSAFAPPPRAWAHGPTAWRGGCAGTGGGGWESYLAAPGHPGSGSPSLATPLGSASGYGGPEVIAPGTSLGPTF
ncbi:hypothetical protein MalM25_15330 [Planctomycetes bacterium MalM25]|nr:hypothetical protein MalM25_15330 [Planctomycetes bacterium MalM25]